MIVTDLRKSPKKQTIDIDSLDLSTVVGRPVVLVSEQFRSKPIKSRVIEATGNTIAIDRGSDKIIDDLIHRQKVALYLEYKGERISFIGELKRTSSGKCNLVLGRKAVPCEQRRFHRIPFTETIRLALLPISNFDPSKIQKLRWFETRTINISGGGILIDLSTRLEDNSHLFLNTSFESIELPQLLIGQVKHCFAGKAGHFLIGVEFIVREVRNKHFSQVMLKNLPSSVFDLTDKRRQLFNEQLKLWVQKRKES